MSYPPGSPSGPHIRPRHPQKHCLTCLGRTDDMFHIAALDVPRRRPLVHGTDHHGLGSCHLDQGTGLALGLGNLGTSLSDWACLAPQGIERWQGMYKHWDQLRQK